MKKSLIFILAFLSIVFVLTNVVYFFMLPDVKKLKNCYTTTLYKVEVCPKKSSYVKLGQVSRFARRAIIVSEDGTFYSHGGFDWFELQESFKTNLKDMKYRRGGSTITQQLAKNAFLSPDKTILRKLLEAYAALELEKNFTKDEIFEKYLNMVEFGPRIYGIKAASQQYFLKPPGRIHLLEAVWLAHLLPNPKVYSRGLKNEKLTKFSETRVKVLLQRLLQYGDITKDQFNFAKSQIPMFPWRHLTVEDFDHPSHQQEDQQKALEELMNSDEWVDDPTEYPSGPETESDTESETEESAPDL